MLENTDGVANVRPNRSANAAPGNAQRALAVQRILCETRNDWIVWFQSCLDEGPDADEKPENLEDFIVWIYPDKIVATEPNAEIVRKLIEWRDS